jgi:hypothetical protein
MDAPMDAPMDAWTKPPPQERDAHAPGNAPVAANDPAPEQNSWLSWPFTGAIDAAEI